MVCVSGFVCIYYNVIICYTIYFLFASFAKVRPVNTQEGCQYNAGRLGVNH